MPRVGLEIRGYNRVRNNLRKLVRMMPDIVEPIGYKWAQRTRVKLQKQKYPPPPPDSKYKRTGLLANKWAVEHPKVGRWHIVNKAENKGRYYASYVVGDERGDNQAWMHTGRWWIASDIVNEEIQELTNELGKEIEKAWRSP